MELLVFLLAKPTQEFTPGRERSLAGRFALLAFVRKGSRELLGLPWHLCFERLRPGGRWVFGCGRGIPGRVPVADVAALARGGAGFFAGQSGLTRNRRIDAGRSDCRELRWRRKCRVLCNMGFVYAVY